MSDVTDLINAAIAENPGVDVWAIAKLVADATPEEGLRAFYADGIVPMVRIVFGGHRNAAARGVRGGFQVSKKVKGIHDYWARFLDTSVAVAGEMKFVGDCTRDDLQLIADGRIAHAAQVRAQAEHYLRIREQMISEGVYMARELSGPVE